MVFWHSGIGLFWCGVPEQDALHPNRGQGFHDGVMLGKRFSSVIEDVWLFVRFTDIFVGKPCVEQDYIVEDITPHQCRLRDMTYILKVQCVPNFNLFVFTVQSCMLSKLIFL